MDAEMMFYLFFLIALIAWPCVQYKRWEWQEKRYQKWHRRNVMMEDWNDV